LFGAGLAVSGMADPARVRAFLDVFYRWDPTLAFVMTGALLPMAAAWAVVRRREAPLAGDKFHFPDTRTIDPRLMAGAVLFGMGWGIDGLCPGPAIASLAIKPTSALVFCAAMAAGFGLFRLLPSPRPIDKGERHGFQAN
jgi:uncharacterized membrane protein YedE/YeeE